MFSIFAEKLRWINEDGTDNADDLCLHGHVIVKIGEECFEYDATVSAAGLYFLRTLTENHIMHNDQAMLPCCGHFLIANDSLDTVDIGGCPNGVDFSVIHEDNSIKFVTETGAETHVSIIDYSNEVNAFADKIEDYYKKCAPKNTVKLEEFERNGYTAFWNEWNRRRK